MVPLTTQPQISTPFVKPQSLKPCPQGAWGLNLLVLFNFAFLPLPSLSFHSSHALCTLLLHPFPMSPSFYLALSLTDTHTLHRVAVPGPEVAMLNSTFAKLCLANIIFTGCCRDGRQSRDEKGPLLGI